ncbi:hypothetical protein BDD12DRAFT_647488, partial [Trichophaea hybrida]
SRREALKRIPMRLNDAYKEIFRKIQQQPGNRGEQAMKVLSWIFLAFKPFRLVELQEAPAIKLGDSSFGLENIPSQKSVMECCMGLVVTDKGNSFVRLVHSSLREYLQSDAIFANSYCDIAKVCITYLNFCRLEESCVVSSPAVEFGRLDHLDSSPPRW